jgi:uncharacterized phage protein (TIGR01671 family)
MEQGNSSERIIRFRARDFDGKWHYSNEYEYGLSEFFGLLENVADGPVLDIDTLGQFTGRTDQNGKDIYGGDVVRNAKITGYRWVIEYRTDTEYVGYVPVEKMKKAKDFINFDKWLPVAKEHLSTFTDWRNLIVIGDIHENADLLK